MTLQMNQNGAEKRELSLLSDGKAELALDVNRFTDFCKIKPAARSAQVFQTWLERFSSTGTAASTAPAAEACSASESTEALRSSSKAGAMPASKEKWDYPDSVDRCQGFTVESVRVLMNCCS